METKTIEKAPDVIFIEWCPSKFVWYDNPVNFIIQPQAYWVSVPCGLMDLIGLNSYPILLWKEEQIQKDYSTLSLSEFAKSCKLQILRILKATRKSIIIFSTSEIMKTVLPTIESDLPRQLSHHIYHLRSSERSKYYIYFDHTPPHQDRPIPFVYEKIY